MSVFLFLHSIFFLISILTALYHIYNPILKYTGTQENAALQTSVNIHTAKFNSSSIYMCLFIQTHVYSLMHQQLYCIYGMSCLQIDIIQHQRYLSI